MFRNRNNSQKPDEAFYSHFKKAFPEVCPEGTSTAADTVPAQPLPHRPAPMEGYDARNGNGGGLTPNGMNDQFALTPSMFDPNSMHFTTLANQPPAYYTGATPGPLGPAVTSQAGSFQTPTMPTSLMTMGPITQGPINEDPVMAPAAMTMGISPFEHSFDGLAQQDPNFGGAFNPQGMLNRPPALLHQDTGFGMMHRNGPEPPQAMTGLNPFNDSTFSGMNGESVGQFHDDDMYENSNEQFRYRVSLRAATAMVKPKEIPITYLNKGQAYTMTVMDSDPLRSGSKPVKYRTYIRISFEDEEQRSKPAVCWQLWKEGRGATEAHQRNGKLLAVEHVDPNQGGDGDLRNNNNSRVQLETASLDGFAVTWTPNQLHGKAECSISVRFSFLSTDFSHSKGVKGIPVRLCAKTEVLNTEDSGPPADNDPEVCYCKVKLFRDHGAERKLANDNSHARKTRDKYEQQRSQAEYGSVNLDRRKSIPSKKHKRTGSLGESAKSSLEQELVRKIDTMEAMLRSPRPISILNLKGDEEDDPDRYPVRFDPSLEVAPTLTAAGTLQQNGDGASPSASHTSFDSQVSSGFKQSSSGFSNGTNGVRRGSLDYSATPQQSDGQLRNGRKLSHPVKVPRAPDAITGPDRNLDGTIDTVGMDPEYRALTNIRRTPKACFHVRLQPAGASRPNGHFHAIYIYEFSASALVDTVAKECRFDPEKIERAVIVWKGRTEFVNDNIVEQLPDGQDMEVEFVDLSDMDRDPRSPTIPTGIEMRLIT